MLQQDNQLKLIHNALEKKIKNELLAMLRTDREKYETFWKEFGRQIKFGAYSDYGMHAELLRDLLLFWSAKEQKMVTLEEYVEKMPAEQKCIYFAAGESTSRLAKLPAAERVLDKGYDLLLLTEDVDEFCLQVLRSYPRKDAEGKDGTVEFKNVNSGDLGLETEEEKKAAEEATTENQSLFDAMQTALSGKVKQVKVSTRLKLPPGLPVGRRPPVHRDGEGPVQAARRRGGQERQGTGAERQPPGLCRAESRPGGRRHRKGGEVQRPAVCTGPADRGSAGGRPLRLCRGRVQPDEVICPILASY